MALPGVDVHICDALLVLSDLADLLLCVPHGSVTPAQLKACVNKLMELCKPNGWHGSVIPKFHWCLHVPSHLERWGLLPSRWTHERKHKHAKRYAVEIYNTRIYSKSVFSEIASHQLEDVTKLGALDLSPGRLAPRKARPELSELVITNLGLPANIEIVYSTMARLHVIKCSKGDFAMIRSLDGINFVVGFLCFFVSAHGHGDFAFVSIFGLRC